MTQVLFRAVVLVAILTPVAVAQESPENDGLSRYTKQLEAAKARSIEEEEVQITKFKNMLKAAKRNRKEAARLNAEIKSSTERIADIRAGKQEANLSLDLKDLKKGDIGKLPGAARILQVVDDNSVIVEVVWLVRLGTVAANTVLPSEFSSEVFWVELASTEGLVDGKEASLRGLFDVVGTKRYATTNGATKTVRHLKSFDPPK